jgi:hypothetical protein
MLTIEDTVKISNDLPLLESLNFTGTIKAGSCHEQLLKAPLKQLSIRGDVEIPLKIVDTITHLTLSLKNYDGMLLLSSRLQMIRLINGSYEIPFTPNTLQSITSYGAVKFHQRLPKSLTEFIGNNCSNTLEFSDSIKRLILGRYNYPITSWPKDLRSLTYQPDKECSFPTLPESLRTLTTNHQLVSRVKKLPEKLNTLYLFDIEYHRRGQQQDNSIYTVDCIGASLKKLRIRSKGFVVIPDLINVRYLELTTPGSFVVSKRLKVLSLGQHDYAINIDQLSVYCLKIRISTPHAIVPNKRLRFLQINGIGKVERDQVDRFVAPSGFIEVERDKIFNSRRSFYRIGFNEYKIFRF